MNRVLTARGPRLGALASACVVAALLGFAPAGHAQVPELHVVAAEAAAAIGQNTVDLRGDARVLVYNFTNAPGSFLRLGSKLADEFDAALRKEARGFVVLERYDNIALRDYSSDDKSACHARPGPNVGVEGYLESFPANEIGLWLKVLRGDKIIFEKRAKLTLPASMAREPDETEIEWPNEMRGEMVWERADAARLKPERVPGKAEGGHAGYKTPTFAECPSPQLTDDAVRAKVQGTTFLDVTIDDKGLPVAISVVKPLPCGLTQQAVNAVKHWKFTPAEKPDGTPISVIVEVEVTFRLY